MKPLIQPKPAFFCVLFAAAALSSQPTQAALYDITIDGSDAVFLAGRTDLQPIPPLDGNPFAFATRRHGYITPEAIVETLPPWIGVGGGDIVKVADPAIGGISFYNGFGNYFGPEGNLGSSQLNSLGALSGYNSGTQGALAGVFLDNSIPNSGLPPVTLDFSSAASRDFLSLSPGLNQVFFIGDGRNSADILQSFVAPGGATRLFFGIPDGFGFGGDPGAYDDNDGAYRIRVGVNEDPTPVPDAGSTLAFLGLATLALGALRNRRA